LYLSYEDFVLVIALLCYDRLASFRMDVLLLLGTVVVSDLIALVIARLVLRQILFVDIVVLPVVWAVRSPV